MRGQTCAILSATIIRARTSYVANRLPPRPATTNVAEGHSERIICRRRFAAMRSAGLLGPTVTLAVGDGTEEYICRPITRIDGSAQKTMRLPPASGAHSRVGWADCPFPQQLDIA